MANESLSANEITPRDAWALGILVGRPSMPEQERAVLIGKMSELGRGIAVALFNPNAPVSLIQRKAADAVRRWRDGLVDEAKPH